MMKTGISVIEAFNIARETFSRVRAEKSDDGTLDAQEVAGLTVELLESVADAADADSDIRKYGHVLAGVVREVLPAIPGDYDPPT